MSSEYVHTNNKSVVQLDGEKSSVFTSLASHYEECRTECVGLNLRRDSFSGRVYDDLCEVILQFLPIKDKFRFECVSKQFQKTVYRRQYELIIDSEFQRSLKIILKKFINIRSLKTPEYTWLGYNKLQDSDIDLIIKNCNHLTEFMIDWSDISETSRDEFISKFYPQLSSIFFNEIHFKLNNILVNINEIEIKDNRYKYHSAKDVFIFYSQNFKPKDLKKLSFVWYISEDEINYKDISKYFNLIIEQNRSVTHLSINFNCFPKYDDSEIENSGNPFKINLSVISQLGQLVSLKLAINDPNSYKSLVNDLKLLSINCIKLKSISLKFHRMSEYFLKTNDFMFEIKKFKKLKRLKFINCYWDDDNDAVIEKYFLNSFKTGFERLTHLVLEIFNEFIYLNDHFIENIVYNIPNLQKLIINNKLLFTKRTVHILSRLSKLQTLDIYLHHYNFSMRKMFETMDSFKEIIGEICRQITTIKVSCNIKDLNSNSDEECIWLESVWNNDTMIKNNYMRTLEF